MKRAWAVLLFFLTVSCLLCGCFRQAGVPVDNAQDITDDSDSVTEEVIPPVIDYGAVIGKSECDLITHDPKTQKYIFSARALSPSILATVWEKDSLKVTVYVVSA